MEDMTDWERGLAVGLVIGIACAIMYCTGWKTEQVREMWRSEPCQKTEEVFRARVGIVKKLNNGETEGVYCTIEPGDSSCKNLEKNLTIFPGDVVNMVVEKKVVSRE